ncbi:MAG TPA: hypothetical protein VJK02_20520 [Anaerolineales bacterium]|nr:hypothetical protein [Anaerolineales bacterium]HLE04376.1 hypothetical protein [Anaerolineales bacterium]
MSPQIIRIVITGALLLHGLAHGTAFIALITDATRSGRQPPVPVHAWLLPSLSLRTTAIIAAPFWLLSTMGFIAASLAFWGLFELGESWRQLAVASSVISTLGIALFSGIWPGAPNGRLSNVDTAIALVMNAAILFFLLWAEWPPQAMFGD